MDEREELAKVLFAEFMTNADTSGGDRQIDDKQLSAMADAALAHQQAKVAELLESRDKFIRVACSAWEDAPDGTALSDILVEKTEEWLSGSLVLSEAERENQVVILRKQVAELEAERDRILEAGKVCENLFNAEARKVKALADGLRPFGMSPLQRRWRRLRRAPS